MAMLNDTTTTTTLVPRAHIEAAQSVTPMKVTDPRQTRQVSVTSPLGSGIFRWCHHIILYFEVESGEDSGWLVAGWMKESLGRALLEQPILAGRLRRGEDQGDGELEVVSNDSGIRLVEARMPKTLPEFLELKAREEPEAEAELVFWKDIDEQNPQFSPLCYVQVTNFECGGYSIGISCSLLLADPLDITSFLKKWADIHKSIVSKTVMPKTPIFYLPNLKPNGSSPIDIIGSNPPKDRGQSMIFKIATKNSNLNDAHTVALLCMEEVERELGVKMASKFYLFVNDLASKNVKVESCCKQGLVEKPQSVINGAIGANWDDFGASEVGFHAGNKPKRLSYWINSASDEGLVMVIPSSYEGISGMNVIVTIPSA